MSSARTSSTSTALFWPAVLKVAELHRPDYVHIHGHLTVNGEKMSKSRGTFINARAYLDLLDPSYLRFYYATLLGSGAEDLDFSLTEFRQRVNAELVNNLGNLANRTLSLLAGADLAKELSPAGTGPGRKLVEDAVARVKEVREAFERFDYRVAMKVIFEIGHSANAFLTVHEPWKSKKTDREGARAALSDAAEVAYLIAALIEPVVPRLAEKPVSSVQRAEAFVCGAGEGRIPAARSGAADWRSVAVDQPDGGGPSGAADHQGIESHGMILTAGPGGKDLMLLDPGAMTPGADVT